MKTLPQFLAALAAVSLLGLPLAPEASISINLGADDDAFPGTTLDPADFAGVVPLANWNNIPAAALEATDLVDSEGVPTGVNLGLNAHASYFAPNGAPFESGDRKMMYGVIYAANSAIDVTITGLDTTYTSGGYDLYVYFRSDSVGAAQPHNLSVLNEAMSLVAGPASVWGSQTLPFDVMYVLSDGNGSMGHYYKFHNLRLTNFVLRASPGTTYTYVNGLQIIPSPPLPFVKSASPSGNLVSQSAVIRIELEDKGTQVDPASIQLYLDSQAVTPTVTKPAGTNVTTLVYDPPGDLTAESPHTVQLIFSDNASPPNQQTYDFGFETLSDLFAGTIINIDINGARNSPGPDEVGATFAGQGAARGGITFNGILADSRLPDGADDNDLTISGANLLDSIGGATTVSFSMSHVTGDNNGSASTLANSVAALFGDYISAHSALQGPDPTNAPFTISGLGAAPTVDLYLYQSQFAGALFFGGVQQIPDTLTPIGNFGTLNTLYFSKVPVSGGTLAGVFSGSPGEARLSGLTIQKPMPGPYVKSASPRGGAVRPGAVVSVELYDYLTQVDPASIQLFFNEQPVSPTTSKPAGTTVTTVSYDPPGDLDADSINTVKIIFSDNSAPPREQTYEFTFGVVGPSYPTQPVISINFSADGETKTLATTDKAGVVPTANWNNVPGGTGALPGLKNSEGIATSAMLELGPHAWYQVGNTAPDGGDKKMMTGYIYAAGSLSLSISGLGSAYTGPGYDLYVYFRSDAIGARDPHELTVLDDANSTVAGPVLVWGEYGFGFDGTYMPGDGSGSPGHYYVFTNMHLAKFTLKATPTVTYTYLNGLQIQALPEVEKPVLTLERQGNNIILSWTVTATLQSADNVTGPWNDVQGATSPHTLTPSAAHQFYRLKQ